MFALYKSNPGCRRGFFLDSLFIGIAMQTRAHLRWAMALAVAIPLHDVTAQRVQTGQTRQDTVVTRTSGGAVAGTVHDSVSRAQLSGALVQLVSADSLGTYGRTVVADSLGDYAFTNVPPGRYSVGFYHPMLDSLGLEPMLHSVTVANARTVRMNLAIPSSLRLRSTICSVSPQSTGALVLGIVRRASDGAPVPDATVAAEWVEYNIGRGGMTRRVIRRLAMTQDNGWFAVCDAPKPGAMTLLANRGADSTGAVELEVPATGFLRQELFLGTAAATMVADTTTATVIDTVSAKVLGKATMRRVFVGSSQLRGVVVAADGNTPLAGAQVGLVDGPETRTNDRGEWSITNAPEGSRMLEVRAVGHYQVRRAVHVAEGAPMLNAPIRTELVTFKSVLETVKVTADFARFSNLAGFRERSKTGLGRFLSASDIERRQPLVTSDLFRAVPGVFMEAGADGERTLSMRGAFSDRCVPILYVNNLIMTGVSADHLDTYVRPNEIAGIEVYSESQVPAQFQPGMNGCGSIVIWTK